MSASRREGLKLEYRADILRVQDGIQVRNGACMFFKTIACDLWVVGN